mgnify:CR=1 FL=1
MADNIRCITTYLIGWRHVQHVVLFNDGSEIVVDRPIPFWLLLIMDRDVIVDWWHVIECGNWSWHYEMVLV